MYEAVTVYHSALKHTEQFQTVSAQGWIIHEAGEAEASGPGPRQGPGPPGTTKIYKVGPLLAPKFLEKICGLLKLLLSGISIHQAVLPQFTPRLNNISKQKG